MLYNVMFRLLTSHPQTRRLPMFDPVRAREENIANIIKSVSTQNSTQLRVHDIHTGHTLTADTEVSTKLSGIYTIYARIMYLLPIKCHNIFKASISCF